MAHEKVLNQKTFSFDSRICSLAENTPSEINGTIFWDRYFLTPVNYKRIQEIESFWQDTSYKEALKWSSVRLDIMELLSQEKALPPNIILIPEEISVDPLESYVYAKIPELRIVLYSGPILSHGAIVANEALKQAHKKNFAMLSCEQTILESLKSGDIANIRLKGPHAIINVTRSSSK